MEGEVRTRDSDTDSDETNRGRDSWRNAHGQEAHERAEQAVPLPNERGKRKAEGDEDSEGLPNDQGLALSSSECWDESEGSTSRSGTP